MANDFGMKVSKDGIDVRTTDIRDILMSSKYSMLKYHSDHTVQITFAPGDTEQYVDINHNLGYVPAFIAYYVDGSTQYFVPVIGRGTSPSFYTYAWADSTKIRCGYVYNTGAYNQLILSPGSSYDAWVDFFSVSGYILVGQKNGNSRSGAVRVPSVNINNSETIVSATLDYAVEYKGSGSGSLNIKTYGIDEDNTSNFSSDPMGRPRTTAVTTQSASLPPAGNRFGINVKSQVEEITTRSGWGAGNAMGFHILNDGSPSEVWVEDDMGTGIDFELKITYGSNSTKNFRVIIFKDKISD